MSRQLFSRSCSTLMLYRDARLEKSSPKSTNTSTQLSGYSQTLDLIAVGVEVGSGVGEGV